MAELAWIIRATRAPSGRGPDEREGTGGDAVGRRTVRLTVDHLAEFPDPCRECLFWELDPVRRDRLEHGECAGEKEAWVSTVLREWGSCGRVVLVDDEPVGYLLYAPAAFVPGSSGFPTAPVSPDAVQLMTAYVAASHAGGGLGRLLVQGMARDLVKHGGIRAVEAFGDSRGRSGHCVVPADFLSSVGFKTQRAHPVYPRMRMELTSAVTWRDEVELALEKLLGVVRPAVRPKAARPHARVGDTTDGLRGRAR
jgi:GNAT superfamily N-acetyltransferase